MAKLNHDAAEHFLELHKRLMLFTNEKYGLYPKFKSVESIIDLSQSDMQNGIMPIRQKMYDRENIKEFCDKNPFELKEKDLHLVDVWKAALPIEGYIVKHLAKYTVIMDQNDVTKLYGIKGIMSDLEEIIPKNHLPHLSQFILLPFMGHIVYDGFLAGYNVHFGSNMRQSILNEYNHNKAIHGIYSEYKTGDNLGDPPESSSNKDKIKYIIAQSLKQGEFPQKALDLAKQTGERDAFEKEYTAKYIKNAKANIKSNPDLPKMFYAAYRESIIGVQENKKVLMDFCKKHYPKIQEYITFFSA